MERTYNIGLLTGDEKNILNDIKNVLVDKGIIEPTLPNQNLQKEIENILQKSDVTLPEWKDLIINDYAKIPVFDYTFTASNGNIYCSNKEGEMVGIWCIEAKTKKAVQIYNEGYSWTTFFETKNGEIIAQNSDNIIRIYTDFTIKRIMAGGWSYIFEASNGDIFLSSANPNKNGIVRIVGETAEKIYGSEYYWQYFFEASNGDIYMGAHASNAGVVYIKDGKATRIYSSGYDFKSFIEHPSGKVYVGGSNGILLLNQTSATNIYSGAFMYSHILTSKGEIYYASSSTSVSGLSSGIVRVVDGVATQIHTGGSSWNYFFENKNGKVYCSSSIKPGDLTGVSCGILYIDGETVARIYDRACQWSNYVVDSLGNIYVSNAMSTSSNYFGLIKLEDDTATLIYDKGTRWVNLFEDSNHVCYFSNKSGMLLELKNGVAKLLYSSSEEWKTFIETPSGLLIASTEYPYYDDSICLLKTNSGILKVLLTKKA